MSDIKAKIIFPFENNRYFVYHSDYSVGPVKLVGRGAEGKKLGFDFEPMNSELCDLLLCDLQKNYPFEIHKKINAPFGFLINSVGWNDDPASGGEFLVDYVPVWFKYLN